MSCPLVNYELPKPKDVPCGFYTMTRKELKRTEKWCVEREYYEWAQLCKDRRRELKKKQ